MLHSIVPLNGQETSFVDHPKRLQAVTQMQLLEQRVFTGDHQALLDVYEQLQPSILRRAHQLVRSHRALLPAYLEAQDLAQEASLVMYQRLDQAQAASSPVAYLLGTGYRVMWVHCLEAMHQPSLSSLDRPRFEDDMTPLHEYIPSSVLPASPYARSDEEAYAPLYAEIEQLPDMQRTVILHYYGIHEHAAEQGRGLRHEQGWSRYRTRGHRKNALVALAFALRDAYPHAVGETLLEAQITLAQRQRLDDAYASLQATSRFIAVARLARAAQTDNRIARAYLQERHADQGIQPAQASCRERGQR